MWRPRSQQTTRRQLNSDTCLPGIMAAERQFILPPQLLQSIGIVESGRTDPATGRVAPWPWTINVAGIDHVYATKAAAIEAVQDLQREGTRSIDVGCMQINLTQHPDAFASLDEAFSPSTNAQYGARFLSALYRETGNWLRAAAAYHSRTQEIGATYEARVMAIWPLANQFSDPTFRRRGQATASEPDASGYTPGFAARMKQTSTDLVRLAATPGPSARPVHQQAKPAGPDYSRYTPEFATRLKEIAKEMANIRAQHAPVVATNSTVRPAGRDDAAMPGRDGTNRDSLGIRIADRR